VSKDFLQNSAPFSLSVVVANFNDGKYLKRCIDSVCSQDVHPNEFIILDDASTDNSVQVIEQAIHGYPFARLVHNPVNLGGGGVPNANKGLHTATGKFVYFLGANDLILPGLFRKVKESLETNPDAGLFSAMVWLMDEQGKYLRMHSSPVLSLSDTFIPPNACRKIMSSQGSWLTGQTTVYRREALVAAGGFDATLGGLCDLMAAQVVASRYGAAYSPTPLGVMRIHGGAFLVATVSDPKTLDAALDEVARRGPLVEPKLFTQVMLERTRLRFYFASLRLSLGASASHIRSKVGTLRSVTLAFAQMIPAQFPQLRTALYLFIMRPFDILPAIIYRGFGAAVVRAREKSAGRYPPNH
jgi:cellulose synthase/poly-beta-1,6-N-acetylglucosamine synthase-like glycosyltransferase